MRDWIELDDFEFETIVGVLDKEQRSLQPLQVSLRMAVELEDAATGNLQRSINYASIYEQIQFVVQYGQWRLLETIAVATCRLVLAPPAPSERRAQVDAVEVRLRKPAILDHAVPGVGMIRDAAWCQLGTRMIPTRTWLDTLAATPRAGAYRAHVEGGGTWNVPPGASWMLLAGSATSDGAPVRVGTSMPRGGSCQVTSEEGVTSTLLVVSSPPLEV
jgi:FolB domain-containing protein